ncbi:MAG: CoA pyrophosphatase [Pelistega sp.]|nr:CoA pyrophosphatase [Pelistega sp.]
MTSIIRHGNPSFNPQTQSALQANHGLAVLPEEHMSIAFIQEALSSPQLVSLDPIIEGWNSEKRLIHAQHPYAEAATLMPLVETAQGIEMLLTRRAMHLKKHSGQISFPGGRIDKEDASAAAAALRETFEEIGVPAEHIQLLGQLPDFFTGTGFLMKPFVAKLSPDYALAINQDEVDEVFSVPLSFLLNPNNHFLHEAPVENGVLRQYFSMPWRDYFIWGATAAVIRNLYYVLGAFHSADRDE